MREFSTNIYGRVVETKVPNKKGYMALLEAVSNSIHSIEEAGIVDGKVEIEIEREKQYQTDIINNVDEQLLPIKSIVIKDNGVGFNDNNFNSFMRCNSDYKQSRFGAKGVGRFTWLKVFKEVKIDSVYKTGDGNKRITFLFKPEDKIDEIYSETQEPVTTIVKLCDIKSEYSTQFPITNEQVAKIIINHFFLNFISEKIPSIIIRDNGYALNINNYFENLKDFTCNETSFNIYSAKFRVYHIKTTTINDNTNKSFLCANTRVVEPIDLRKCIKNLQSSIGEISGKKVWYFSYVCSDYLNEIVNTERTQINFPHDDSDMEGCVNISKETFVQKLSEEISSFLEKDIEQIERIKIERIDRYIDTKRPNYKNLRRFMPNFYKNIENDLNDEKLEIALFRERLAWQKEINNQYDKILKKAKTLDYDKLNELKDEYLKNISQFGKDYLAEYIINRKAILDMLDNYISEENDSGYSLEEAVHSLICPMRTTSEELNYDDMNLWIIDEKLAYHYYLASDKTMKTQLVDGKLSNKEPDIVIYDNPLVFNDMQNNYNALSIIEFKRPMRDNYTSEDNPIEQVYGYIEEIRNGKKKDRRGKLLEGDLQNIPIYSYIIADLTETLRRQCKNFGLSRLPADDGYFGYSAEYKTFVQVISYNKLYRDSVNRNKILFDKLFLKNE